MNLDDRIQDIKASLLAIGVAGAPLGAIIALVKEHARPGSAWRPDLDGQRPTEKCLGEIAGKFLAGSLRRKEYLGNAADDPSWNMLLAMFSGEAQGVRTSVAAACHASGAAPTTALRHIDALVKSGLVRRTPDPTDLRRSFLYLNPSTMGWMTELITGFCVEPPRPSSVFR